MTESRNVYDSMEVWGTEPDKNVPVSVALEPNTDPNIPETLSSEFMVRAINRAKETGDSPFERDHKLVKRLTSYGKEILVGRHEDLTKVAVGAVLSLGLVVMGYKIKNHLTKPKLPAS